MRIGLGVGVGGIVGGWSGGIGGLGSRGFFELAHDGDDVGGVAELVDGHADEFLWVVA